MVRQEADLQLTVVETVVTEEERLRRGKGSEGEAGPSTQREAPPTSEDLLEFTPQEVARFAKYQEQQAARQAAIDQERQRRQTLDQRSEEAAWRLLQGPNRRMAEGLPPQQYLDPAIIAMDPGPARGQTASAPAPADCQTPGVMDPNEALRGHPEAPSYPHQRQVTPPGTHSPQSNQGSPLHGRRPNGTSPARSVTFDPAPCTSGLPIGTSCHWTSRGTTLRRPCCQPHADFGPQHTSTDRQRWLHHPLYWPLASLPCVPAVCDGASRPGLSRGPQFHAEPATSSSCHSTSSAGGTFSVFLAVLHWVRLRHLHYRPGKERWPCGF